jgi:hypothetical protein
LNTDLVLLLLPIGAYLGYRSGCCRKASQNA